MLIHLLPLFIFIPLLGFAACLCTPRKRERTIYSISILTVLLELVLFLVFACLWLGGGFAPLSANIGSLYTSPHYALSFDLYFDRLSAVFFGMAAVMTTLVFSFSRRYMHRDPGFKRFYSTIFLFFIGLSCILLGGNFEVLFLGWEFIGISSVLLIAFYRDRFLPARNAMKVFSVYRIADAALLVAVWYAHHLFGKSIHFSELSSIVAQYGNDMAVLGLFLLIVASVKSAQFPFSYWLPRAMEGPTASTAIFYGALSVHVGLYLLLRTYPLWEGSIGFRVAVGLVGLVTAVVASSITRVQSSIKTQIAYASITQIGLMFIELAAGLQWLVLLHFVSNASLRTYQLLISPSAVSYFVHDQFFYFVRPAQRIKNTLFGKLLATFYVLSIKEWNMNTVVSYYVWRPLKAVGRTIAFMDGLYAQLIALACFLAFAGAMVTMRLSSAPLLLVLSTGAAVVSIAFYIRAYATKKAPGTCWNLIMLGHLFGALFLAVAAGRDWGQVVVYGAGIIVAFVAGHLCLWYLRTRGEANALYDYSGSMYRFTKLGHVFFIVSLLFMAFPISPSFLAQDILLSRIPKEHSLQIALFCFSYLLVGVSVMRLYVKVFFGPHKESHHEIAYKSS